MERDSIMIRDESVVAEYHQLQDQLSKLKQSIRDTISQPIHCVPYLQPGRLLKVKEGDRDWGWGVVVNFQKVAEKVGNFSRNL